MTKLIKNAKHLEKDSLEELSRNFTITAKAELKLSGTYLHQAQLLGGSVDTAGAVAEAKLAKSADNAAQLDVVSGKPTAAAEQIRKALTHKNHAIEDLSSFVR